MSTDGKTTGTLKDMFVFEVFPSVDVLFPPIPNDPNMTPIPVLSSELDVLVRAMLKLTS